MSHSLDEFAGLIVDIIKTDRWVLEAADGQMGEGKSCFNDKLSRKVAQKLGTKYSLHDNMIYLRKDLEEALKGKLPDSSVIHADELISMFFRRNWYDADQIDGIELLNKCRDRHFFVSGNIPNFWELDSSIQTLVTFYVHVHRRGIAWVFRPSENPMTRDKWNRAFNEKLFDKSSDPYKLKGFVMEIKYDDWSPDERKEYYKIRNEKKKETEGQRADKVEKYADIKGQRDALIRHIAGIKIDKRPIMTQEEISDIVGLHRTMIASIIAGGHGALK